MAGWLPSRTYSTAGLMDGLMKNFTDLMEQELKARLQSLESVKVENSFRFFVDIGKDRPVAMECI